MNRLAPLPVGLAVDAAAQPAGKPAQSGRISHVSTGHIAVGSPSFSEHLRIARDGRERGTHDPQRDLLHSAARHLAQLAPSASTPLPPTLAEGSQRGTLPTPISVEELWPALVRKAAWSGDARRGTVRLELGAGALEGAVVLVHSDNGRVHVKLTAPRGVDLTVWRTRIAARLAVRGLDVEAVEVD